MPHYFETKVSYDTTAENGIQKKVNEVYCVFAETFTDAEACVTKELQPFANGEFAVSAVRKSRIAEVWEKENDEVSDKWYKARIAFVHINPTTMQEKRDPVTYLVRALSVYHALKLCKVKMDGTVTDYEIESVVLTPIKEVFQ